MFKSEKERGKKERERKLRDKLGGIYSQPRRRGEGFNGNPNFFVEVQ